MSIKKFFLALFISLLSSGIAGAANTDQKRPGKTRLRTDLPAAASFNKESQNYPVLPLSPTTALTLEEALTLALRQNPELQTFSGQIEARQGETQQAQALPNPEMGIEVENILGEDDNRAFKSAETTLEISQLIELGDKRQQRIRVADLKQQLADFDLESARLDVISTTNQAFFLNLSTQARVELARENLQLAEKIFNTVQLRVEAGKTSPIAENQALITVRQSRLTLKKEQHKLTAAQRRLAAGWGADKPHFKSTVGNIETIFEPLAWAVLHQRLEQNPKISRQTAELELQESRLALAQAYSIPDVTLGGGIKRHEDNDDYTFLLGVSFSLPVFDRNQGNIRTARAETGIRQKKELSKRIELKTSLRENYELLLAAYEEADSLRNSILPAAETNFSATDYGYRQGQFKFIDVLTAQKNLFEIRGQLLDSLTDFHVHRLNIEAITGQKLADNFNKAPSNPISTTEDK